MFVLSQGDSVALIQSMILMVEISNNLSKAALSRVPKVRPSWSQESSRFSDRMFLRLFRMYRQCFNCLCNRIEKAVGEKVFKSEKYLDTLRASGASSPFGRMNHASETSCGSWIPGEAKLAMTLRYLAGASYLDLYLWFNVSPEHILIIIRDCIKQWLCNDDVFAIDFYGEVLQRSSEIERISRDYSEKSGGIMSGCFGAIDGWLVKIKCPTLHDVNNPGKYMSRKGFFALNVQAIVDKKKRILWRLIGEKGSAHDSTVFKNSTLYKHLMLISDELYEKRLYLVGDSAYSLRGFLLCPYDNATSGSAEDSFNYFLSSQRIYVECAFGEVDRRFGIFWRPLEGSLHNHQFTIDACLRLHNFIVDFREGAEALGDTGILNEIEELEELNHNSDSFMMNNAGHTMGVYGEEERARGSQHLMKAGRGREDLSLGMS